MGEFSVLVRHSADPVWRLSKGPSIPLGTEESGVDEPQMGPLGSFGDFVSSVRAGGLSMT